MKTITTRLHEVIGGAYIGPNAALGQTADAQAMNWQNKYDPPTMPPTGQPQAYAAWMQKYGHLVPPENFQAHPSPPARSW